MQLPFLWSGNELSGGVDLYLQSLELTVLLGPIFLGWGAEQRPATKPQSGGKLCDFFGKLVLFVCILALLAGCCLGFLEEAFENEVNFKSISFGEHYLLQGYGQELFVAFMGLLNFINVAWWSIACTSTSALGVWGLSTS